MIRCADKEQKHSGIMIGDPHWNPSKCLGVEVKVGCCKNRSEGNISVQTLNLMSLLLYNKNHKGAFFKWTEMIQHGDLRRSKERRWLTAKGIFLELKLPY